eukprot:1534898-Amphidinium_carterae.1
MSCDAMRSPSNASKVMCKILHWRSKHLSLAEVLHRFTDRIESRTIVDRVSSSPIAEHAWK